MSFKSLLVPAISEHTFPGALESAFEIARVYNSHVVACHIRQPFDASLQPLPYPLEMSSMSQARAVYDETMDALSEKFRGLFEAGITRAGFAEVPLEGEGLPDTCTATWILRNGDPFEAICRNGRVNDCIIMQHSEQISRIAETDLRQRITTEIGKPIFLVPEAGMHAFPKSVAIGWNGSLEVTRALTAALPLLQKVQRIVFVAIGKLPDNRPTAQDAARYLRYHGLEAEVAAFERSEKSVTGQISNYAVENDIGLLILGGYSHSRMRERIFGGVTHEILSDPAIPAFIVH